MVIDGKATATNILDKLQKRVGELEKKGIVPHLAVILVGDDASSQAYVRQKELKAKSINCKLSLFTCKSTISEKELLDRVRDLNRDSSVHAILVQRPLPAHIDEDVISYATDPQKDVDGFHPASPFIPPIALAVLQILEEIEGYYNASNDFYAWLRDKDIVLLGKGRTAGQPIMNYFQKLSIPLTVIDSKTEHKDVLLQKADIVISAMGKPHTLNPHILKKGVVLLGVGMDKGTDGRMYPDYDEKQIKDIASFYTPVPGGVGPVNVAMLLVNVIQAAENVRKIIPAKT